MSVQPEGIQTITSGATASVTAGVGIVIVNPGSLMAALALTLPAAPADRDDLFILAGGTITSGLVVTTFSIVGTVLGAVPSALTSGVSQQYKYFQSVGKWYRIV